MEKLGLVDMLQTGGYERWRNQDGDNSIAEKDEVEDKVFVKNLTSRVLTQLRFTGIRSEIGDNFRIGWVLRKDLSRCIDIPIAGANLWARILADSPEQATFACITPECLQSTSQEHRCQNKPPESWAFKRKFQLSTKVRAYTVVSGASPSRCELVVGKAYWIGPIAAMLLAEFTQKPSCEKHFLVRGSKLPLKTFRRLIDRPWIKEIDGNAAEACLISSAE